MLYNHDAAGRSRNEALASAAEAMESRSQAERSAQEARTAQQAETQRAEEARKAKLEAEARQAEASATLNFLTNKLLANSDPGINLMDKRSFTSKQTRDSWPGGIDFDSIAFAAPVLDAGVDAQNPTVLEVRPASNNIGPANPEAMAVIKSARRAINKE